MHLMGDAECRVQAHSTAALINFSENAEQVRGDLQGFTCCFFVNSQSEKARVEPSLAPAAGRELRSFFHSYFSL
jgi:hypothetical protein